MTIDCNTGRHESPLHSVEGNTLGDALGYSYCDLNCYGDLIYWIKAHCINLEDGDPVPVWPGSAETPSISTAQANALYRPTFQTNQANGLPAVQFNGTDQQFTLTGSLNGSADYTFMIVMKQTSSTGNQGVFEMYVDPLGTASGLNFYPINGIPFMYHSDGAGGQVQVIGAGSLSSDWIVLTIQSEDQDTHRLYINGVLIQSSSANGLLDTTGVTNGLLGAHYNGLTITDFFEGSIAEAAHFTNVLDDANRSDAENCLMEKYGIVP